MDYAFRLEHELGEAVHRARCPECGKVVGAAGIEPATSAMSTQRSTTELRAQRDKTETWAKHNGKENSNLTAPTGVMSKSSSQAKKRVIAKPKRVKRNLRTTS